MYVVNEEMLAATRTEALRLLNLAAEQGILKAKVKISGDCY